MGSRFCIRSHRVALCAASSLLLVSGGSVSRAESSAAPALRTSPERDFIYSNTAAGGRIAGSKEALIAAARSGDRLGVTWLSWHGEVSAECDQVVTDLDGKLECLVEHWCEHALEGAPVPHAHKTRVASSGTLSSILLAHKGTDEVKIWALGEGVSSVQWYRIDPPAAPAPLAAR